MEMIMDLYHAPIYPVLHILLEDKTTKKNIIWATDSYAEFGLGFADTDPIRQEPLFALSKIIRPRVLKSQEAQADRTRKRAEVFTPAWLCNQMNNVLDRDWFSKDVFNIEESDYSWKPVHEKVPFSREGDWQRYVDSRRLEITCGEAPYLVSRYDVATGKRIDPMDHRIGILDRKLRVVSENTETEEDWVFWAFRALEATYGYEYQGDNLLMARGNVLLTFVEAFVAQFHREPDPALITKAAHCIAWNLWQMDGLKDIVPLGKLGSSIQQLSFLEPIQEESDATFCRIRDWRRKRSVVFHHWKEGRMKKMFDFVIGNPPYNENFENSGENGNYAKPVYQNFMDASYEIADKVELIHPARFLFNAGSTPKNWNRKMLNDEHFKILRYEANSKNLFSNVDIKGGVVISYRDEERSFGAIGTFTAFDELNSILRKVNQTLPESLSDIIYPSESYRFTQQMHDEIPGAEVLLSNGHKYDFKTSVFTSLNHIVFFDEKPDNREYVQVLGLMKAKRAYKWIRRDFVDAPDNFEKYKVFVPTANGSGALGEVLSTPLIGQPLIGHTQTFLSIGAFEERQEAENLLRYLKTKFSRVMLGILKITQHNPAPKWKYVPLQDFTSSSDIDWSQSIHEIDLQLYRKYGLTEEEIRFIETHVKEMA